MSVFFVSCQKDAQIVDMTTTTTSLPTPTGNTTRSTEEEIEWNGGTYLISNDMLNFTSFGHYENIFEVSNTEALDDLAQTVENSQAMISYNETVDIDSRKDFIGSLVNYQGVIKINVYTIMLDFTVEKVYATRYGTIQNLLAVKNGGSNDSVYTFTMAENDVIEELAEIKSRGILCNASFAQNRSKFSIPITTNILNPGNVNCPLQAGVSYQKSGIYFQMTAESYCTNWATLLGTSTVVPRKLEWWGNWKRRCGDSGSFNTSSTATQTWSAVNNRFRCIVYGNVRALTTFSLTAKISSPNSIPSGASETVAISN